MTNPLYPTAIDAPPATRRAGRKERDVKNDDLKKMVKELLADESDRLSGWECDFLSDMKRWTGEFSEKQASIIERIWNKIFG